MFNSAVFLRSIVKFKSIVIILMGLSTWKSSYSGMYLQILTLDTSPDSEIGKHFARDARTECGLLPWFGPALTCEECPRPLHSPVWKA